MSEAEQKPRASIGLPVYNGENYLSAAVESLLGQTYKDFEIVITDNASTDRTEAICTSFAAQDTRIKYVRNPNNLGAAGNFNRAFQLSRGEYFKWAACDDLLEPEYLEKAVRVLDSRPDVVLVHSRVKFVDERGRSIERPPEKHALVWLNPYSPHDRFGDMILRHHACYEAFGLIRADILATTSLIGGYTNSDRVLLAELCLHGAFHYLPDPLFISRHHPSQSVSALPDVRARAVWFDARNRGRILFPHWRALAELRRAIARSPAPGYQRVRAYLHLGRWVRNNRYKLMDNCTQACRQFFVLRRAGYSLQASE